MLQRVIAIPIKTRHWFEFTR